MKPLPAIQRIRFLLSALLITAMSSSAAAEDAPGACVAQQAIQAPNGLYLVLRENENEQKLEPLVSGERALINDYHFLDEKFREKPAWMVVSTSEYVPFIIASSPVKDKTADGKPNLMLQLAKSQVVPLETFTRKHCGKKVAIAIVIGGQIVTAHKIREPITGGRLQISYCTGNGCNVLYSMLEGERGKE